MIPERYKNSKYDNVPNQIKDLFENIKSSRRGIYIYGSVGCGKTHLLYALKSKWEESNKPAIFRNTVTLIQSIRSDFDKINVDKERDVEFILNSASLLMIDDIGAEKITDFVSETFYSIINHRYEKMYPIIFTSNLSIEELANKIGDRIASRIVEMCVVVS